jgi:hypothetical protein
MIHELEVTGDEASASPTDDVPTVGLVDYGFELPAGGLASGTYRVENQSVGQPHELVVARVNDGSTYEEAAAALTATAPAGPPPITELDGVTALSPGEHGVIDLELAPGTYVLACYLPDASDGVPHVAKGMLRELDVG